MRKAVALQLAILFCLLVAPVATQAQSFNGSIAGKVMDTTGAVVANADLVLKNVATGVELRRKSTDSGDYAFRNLVPGTYELRANSAGALLFWPKTWADQRTRRLQLAAQESQTLAFLFMSTARAAQPSPSPLRIRLSLSGTRLAVDILKRRGGALSAPLLLDIAGSSADTPNECAPSALRPPAKSERLPANRTASFHRHYPVGGPQARIWNRALARADEVRRVPGPDPRGGDSVSQ